jgi:hypothetical protein
MLVFDLDGWVLRGRLVLKRGGYKGSYMDYHREELSPRLREFLDLPQTRGRRLASDRKRRTCSAPCAPSWCRSSTICPGLSVKVNA